MIPGWIAGHYGQGDIRIDLQKLADSAGVTFIVGRMVAMDADKHAVLLSDGSHLFYDHLSLDIGSESKCDWLEACGPRLLTIKPLEEFQEGWQGVARDAAAQDGYKLVVVGGGAAGVELALSAKHALKRVSSSASVQIVTGSAGLLSGHSDQVRRRALRVLGYAGIELVAQRAAGTETGVLLGSGASLSADTVLAATGASAPAILRTSGLGLDKDGFIKVDSFHRSLSHPNVFAAGDVCSRDDPYLQRSGVHAVHTGPILANNLLSAIDGRTMKAYRPRASVLYLLACGEKYAIASWGWFSVEGKWVWRWKDYIDRRFVARFSP